MKKPFVFGILLAALILIVSCSAQTSEPQSVRHVILWTLSDTLTPQQKQQLIATTAADIAELPTLIPGVISMDIYYEGRLESSNCDFMFDFRFRDEQALQTFTTHPAHLAAAAKLKPYITGRACLDMRE